MVDPDTLIDGLTIADLLRLRLAWEQEHGMLCNRIDVAPDIEARVIDHTVMLPKAWEPTQQIASAIGLKWYGGNTSFAPNEFRLSHVQP